MLHGTLEWLIIVLIAISGYITDRFLPGRRVRYPIYALLMLTAFIFDLNEVVFRANALNAVWYGLILLIIAEIFWKSLRKRSKPLLCAVFVGLPPVFLFVFAAALLSVPLPCHNLTGGTVGERTECGGGVYSLSVRPSFDPFKPGRIFALHRDIRFAPLKRRVDSYAIPEVFAGTRLTPHWECAPGPAGDAVRVRLSADGYILWALRDKTVE